MSFVLLGILNSQASAGAIAQVYYFSTLAQASSSGDGNITLDSSDAFILTGSDNFFVRYQPDSTVDLQKEMIGQTVGSATDWVDAAFDTSGNIYVVGDDTNDYVLAVKLDTDGNVIWKKQLDTGDSPGTGGAYRGCAIDSNNNLYAAGYSNYGGAGSFDFLTVKYDSSGNLVWQKMLGTAEGEVVQGIEIDSSDNVYICAEENLGVSTAGVVVKYDSSGNIVWQKEVNSTNTARAQGFDRLAFDSSDNVYAVGRDSDVTPNYNGIWLVKLNSSGVSQWQRTLHGADQSYGYGVAVDADDNVYVVGETESEAPIGVRRAVMAKYDSSGTIVWQRTIGNGTDRFYGYSVEVTSGGDIIFAGETNNASLERFVAALPADGSLTGNYTLNGVNFDYAASGLTVSNQTHPVSNTSMSASTPTTPETVPTITEADPAVTITTLEI